MPLLSEALLDEVVHRLAAEFDPDRIILFGSHAWGTPHEDSDIDLLVIVDSTLEKPSRRSVRAYLCTRGLGVPMDLLVWTRDETDRLARTRTSLASEILERGIVLYDRRGEEG